MRKRSEKCACGVLLGENHSDGCDWEECPFCRGQLIACGCDFHLKLNLSLKESRIANKEGFNDEQSRKLDEILDTKGRIPFGSERHI